MACFAQIPESITVDVNCSNNGCNPFVDVDPCYIRMKEITCCIIRGTVLCGTDGDTPVAGALVFATGPNDADDVFAGITNDLGEYTICVPASGEYTIECFCCAEECCEDAPCECGCAENGNGETMPE